ncbi:DUF2125 domain-containing protein [Martelella sp. HB161492]|uniref:DUF2125 domain-containing protein n=1 Tax=Martelella sp. HB161492 TaxID=2720726 RepID=UPI001590AAE7|nr:DUF2125 domain-containing protein [Martelella sp. HB161492]
MAASSRTRKLLRVIGVILVVIIVAYGLGWFYVARTVKARIFTLLEGTQTKDVMVECGKLGYQGFPLQFGFYCDDLHLRQRDDRFTFDLPKLVADAPAYSPWSVMAHLQGPATLKNEAGFLLRSEWTSFDTKMIYGKSAPRQLSFSLDGLSTQLSMPAGNQSALTLEQAQGLVRNQDGDLDVALSVDSAVVRPGNRTRSLEPMSLNLVGSLKDGGALMGGDLNVQQLKGKSGVVDQVELTVGDNESYISAAGPFSFDTSGYLSGRFKFEVAGLDVAGQMAQMAFPDYAQVINTIVGFAGSLSPGNKSITIGINVDGGKVSMGFIPLGKIPPLK